MSNKLRLQQSPISSTQSVVCVDSKIQSLSTTAADGSTSSVLPRELNLRGNVEEWLLLLLVFVSYLNSITS